MQKIKYIIIATLLLALAIIYSQFLDYKNISSILLKENENLINKTHDLNDKITSLEESLSIKEIELYKPYFRYDLNTTSILLQNFNLLNKMSQEAEKSALTPNIKLDEENKILNFKLEYKQEF